VLTAAGEGALLTIVIAPREKYSFTRATVERLLAMSTPAFELVIVDDVRAPRRLRRWLTEEAARQGFRYVTLGHRAGVNEARMVGFTGATTPYTIFIDNDVWLHDGAIAALLSCVEETNASCVAPVYCIGRHDDDTIHHACGALSVVQEDGRPRLRESDLFYRGRLRDVRDQMRRQPAGAVELHLVLVRTDALRAAGGLDTNLGSSMDCVDLSFRMQAQVGGVWFEPAAVVTYDHSQPRRGDLALYLSRWSATQVDRDIERFVAEWQLDPADPRLQQHRGHLTRRQMKFLPSARRVARKLVGRRGMALANRTADKIVNRGVGSQSTNTR
jgi:GT2 family glycosyltransferase